MRYLFMNEYVIVFFHHDPKQERPYIVDNAWSINGFLISTGGRDRIHPSEFKQFKNSILTIIAMYEGGIFNGHQ